MTRRLHASQIHYDNAASGITADTAQDAVDAVNNAVSTHTHAASAIVSGTFDDARVAESNVTQHEGAIDHDALTNFDAGEHRSINDAGTGATELWSASKINTELSGKAATSHTHAAGDVTSGTFADARIAESNVTQHQAAIDHDALTGFSAAEHRTINDAGSATTDLWSADKIGTELAGKSDTGHTHAASDVTSGTFADARISESSVTQHADATEAAITRPSVQMHLTSGDGALVLSGSLATIDATGFQSYSYSDAGDYAQATAGEVEAIWDGPTKVEYSVTATKVTATANAEAQVLLQRDVGGTGTWSTIVESGRSIHLRVQNLGGSASYGVVFADHASGDEYRCQARITSGSDVEIQALEYTLNVSKQ